MIFKNCWGQTLNPFYFENCYFWLLGNSPNHHKWLLHRTHLHASKRSLWLGSLWLLDFQGLQMTEIDWNLADWSRKHQGTWKCHLIDETFSNLDKLKVFLINLKRKNLQTSFSRNITFQSAGKDWRWPKNPNNAKFGGILLLWIVHKMSGRVFRLAFMVAHTGCLNFLISDEILTLWRKFELQGTEGLYSKTAPLIS